MALIDPSVVRTRDDLSRFLEQMAMQLRDSSSPLENRDLASFVSAAAGWVSDMHGYCENRGEITPESPTWSTIAAIFAAAAVYE